MIHMHSMLSPETNTSAAGHNSKTPLGHAALNQAKLDSFHSALSDAVSSTLEKFGIHPHDVKISITRNHADPATPASTNSNAPVRTAPPTPGTQSSSSGSGSATSTGTTSGPPNGGYDPFLQAAYSNPFQNAATQQASTTSTAPTTAPLDAQQIFDNNYWAQQPAAVQPLRTMQDQNQREAMATQLASEGHSIDVPIMVWGWDPSVVTSMRQAEGYTWVPSALQAPVDVAPGLPGMGTLAAYDPNNPPAGSIAV
jgi:hypothetical protein